MPIQTRARRTRELLLQAGESLFSSQGYAATTAKGIAAAAGVATGSFYQYFKDKDALLHELARARSELLLEQAELAFEAATRSAQPALGSESSRRSLARVLRLVLKMHQDDSGLHAVLEQRRLSDEALSSVIVEAERRYQEMIERALLHWGFGGDAQATAFTLFHMVEGVIHGHVLGQRAVSDARLLSTLVDALIGVAQAGTVAGEKG